LIARDETISSSEPPTKASLRTNGSGSSSRVRSQEEIAGEPKVILPWYFFARSIKDSGISIVATMP